MLAADNRFQGSSGSGWPRLQLIASPAAYDREPVARLPHVLLAVDQLPRNLGGGERVLLRLASLLPQYGFRGSILTLAADPDSPALSGTPPCPINLLPLTRTYGPEAMVAALRLRQFLLDQNIRLVQTFFESSDLWVGPVAKLMAGIPLIWSRRDMGILRGSKHHVAYRLMAKLPDAVLAVSEQVRRYSIEVDGIPANRVETLYNGLDLANWFSSDKERKVPVAPVIKTVGNIRRVKGHDIFLRAAALVAQRFPEARFSIGGGVLEPEFYQDLEQLARSLQIEDRVTFEGPVSDLHSYLADAAVFVLPSRSEGFSNAIVEAMAAGLPVVATDVGGNAEAVQDGTTGRIVPPENPQALASAICEVLGDPNRAKAMGEAARERVSEKFTTEAMMKQLVSVYHRVLGWNW